MYNGNIFRTNMQLFTLQICFGFLKQDRIFEPLDFYRKKTTHPII